MQLCWQRQAPLTTAVMFLLASVLEPLADSNGWLMDVVVAQ
jgi:hypothetical protein